jgi:ABC-type uncharacterized transport system auxiliary subunit
MRNRKSIVWILALSAGFAGGCGAARPSRYYQLTVPADGSRTSDPTPYPVTLIVGRLTASRLYRGDYLVYSSANETMGTYQYERWAQPPTDMIEGVLSRELRVSGRFRSVNSLSSNAQGDYVMRGQLYDFKEISANPLVARLVMEWELRDTKTGATVWSHYYAHDEPVSGKDVAAVVAALDRNVQGAVNEIRASLEQYFSAHPPAPAAQ